MTIIRLLHNAEFRIQRIEEAQDLAEFISEICPSPNIAIVGMTEVFFNAIEHGNLGITCHEKTELQKNGDWLAEIEKRIASTEHAHKFVTVFYSKTDQEIILKIVDQGDGFDWKKYENEAPQSLLSTHGRGLDIAKKLVFSSMQYSEKGNEVTCVMPLT
jgi:hypothetical protein